MNEIFNFYHILLKRSCLKKIKNINAKNSHFNTVDLHWIFSVAKLEVSFPRVLLATHRYSPLSVLFTLVIVSCLLCCCLDKLILELLFIGDPSFVHDIVGAGFPVALQDKVKISPSVVVTLRG